MRLLILVLSLPMVILGQASVAAAAQATRPATADAPPTDLQRRVLLASLSAYSAPSPVGSPSKTFDHCGRFIRAGAGDRSVSGSR
jgi:hypothetical protein